jgi:hypothetical protein
MECCHGRQGPGSLTQQSITIEYSYCYKVNIRPSYEEFKEQLNKNFELRIDGAEPIQLELIEVSERTVTPKQEMFSLIFRMRGSEVLPQQIYSLENGAMGQTELFLVPVGKDNEAVFYEAVFNRFLK